MPAGPGGGAPRALNASPGYFMRDCHAELMHGSAIHHWSGNEMPCLGLVPPTSVPVDLFVVAQRSSRSSSLGTRSGSLLSFLLLQGMRGNRQATGQTNALEEGSACRSRFCLT